MEIPATTLYTPLISCLPIQTGSFSGVRTHAFYSICMSHTTYPFLFNSHVQSNGTPLIEKQLMVTQCLLCPRNYYRCFSYINLFSYHSNLEQVIITPIYFIDNAIRTLNAISPRLYSCYMTSLEIKPSECDSRAMVLKDNVILQNSYTFKP